MKAYVKTQPESLINVSRIVTIHYYEFDRNFRFDGESHDFWEMVYVDRGQVHIRRDEEELTLSQGDIIFHRPNEFHSIRALDSSPNFFVISFVCKSPAMAYFEKYTTKLQKRLTAFVASIISEAEKTYEIPKNDPSLKRLTKKSGVILGGEQLIKIYLEELLIFLIRDIAKEGEIAVFPTKESMENHLISGAKKFIYDNTDGIFRVDALCQKLGYSKSYLSKLFREQTGYTIADFAQRAKIDSAKRLIREGDMNFAEISDRLSFDNPQYFSRVFKRITGMTPTEFKASLNFTD